MARSELTDLLRRMHAACDEASRRRIPVEEAFEAQRARTLTRGGFLAGAAAAAGTLALRPMHALGKQSGQPRIVIVGGGLAGVTCAYRLRQAGLASTLYEANGNVGGRTWTLRDYWDDGQITENGGEFISSEHAAMRDLTHELGFELVDLRAAQPKGTEEVYWVRGQRVSYRAMLAEYALVFPRLKAANDAAGYPTLFNHYTPAAYKLDHMSAREWIEANVPGGTRSTIGWMLDLDTTTENGGEASEQSSLELIYMLGHMPAYNPEGGFYWVGTDEKYGVKGGNDQLVHAMAAKLGGAAVHPYAALVALRKRADGSFACTFESQLRRFDVPADYVVLACPFTALRRCDLSKAGFSKVKMTAIRLLPMGTNTKIYMQFKDRSWHAVGCNGNTYADTGYQQTLDASRGQAGRSGILEFYTGGRTGASFGPASFGPPSDAVARRQLHGLEPLIPSISSRYNGKAFMDYWTGDPWHKGSYSYWGVGHQTLYAGAERVRQGNALFCGEHTAVDFAGFMNGAVLTGEQAAGAILAQERVRARAGA